MLSKDFFFVEGCEYHSPLGAFGPLFFKTINASCISSLSALGHGWKRRGEGGEGVGFEGAEVESAGDEIVGDEIAGDEAVGDEIVGDEDEGTKT